MAVEVRPVVLARRPRAEVTAFIFDPGNGLNWTGGITSNRPAQPKPHGREQARFALPPRGLARDPPVQPAVGFGPCTRARSAGPRCTLLIGYG